MIFTDVDFGFVQFRAVPFFSCTVITRMLIFSCINYRVLLDAFGALTLLIG